jgi:hypothetical protein
MKIEALVILGVGAAALYRVWIWLKNAPYTPDPWGAEIGGTLEDPESAPVCPHCLIPQEHNGWFCPECGSTVGQFSNYLPAVYMFSMGEAFRRGVTERMRNHPLVITGYVLVTLSHFFLVAPILWYFLFRQFQQTAHPGEGQEVG